MTTTAPPPGVRRSAPRPSARRVRPPEPEPVRSREWRRTLGAAVWAAGLTATGALSLAGVWDAWLPAIGLLLVAVLPLALLRGVLALGVSRWVAAVVITVLLVLVAYLMTASAGTDLLGTLADAVPRLLTEPTPYAARADLLAGPVLLTGLVSVLAGLRIDERTRVGPVAGALVLYVCGALLSGGEGDPHGLIAILLVVLAVAGWVLLERRTEPARQRIATGLPVVSALGVLLAVVATAPTGAGFEPSEHVDPPTLDVETASPLPRLGAWTANPDAELFRVAGEPVPLRLVTLRTHDGSQWRAATSYAPIGATGGRSLPAGEQRREVSESVELTGIGGPWLPTPGDPTRVSERDAVVDLESGTVYDPEAADGTRFQVTAVVDDPDPQDLVTATVPTTGAARAYLGAAGLPGGLAAYAERVVRGATTPYERALALEHAVESDRRLSAQATSGSAYWRIEQFLLGDADTPGGRVGTSEQFATAFALLARHVGLPTRVVVGFRPGTAEDDGTRVVRGGDALAWPEVYFDRLGWVPFSPTPNDDTFDDGRPVIAPAPAGQDGSGGGTDGPSASATPTPEPDQDDATPAAAPPADGPTVRQALLVLGGLAGVVLLGLVLLRVLRSRRHLRHGAPGAWAEVLDALVLSGARPDPSRTATDLADATDARLGTRGARALADRAEQAAFGPGPGPAPDGRPAELREVRRAARAGVPAWRRWWWWLDPRVLGR